jgi:FMN-dependent NADH-azoreductase
MPPSFDHQAPYLDFWLRLIGVRDCRSVIVDNAWNRDRQESEVSLAKGKATLERLVEWFVTESRRGKDESTGSRTSIHKSKERQK